MSERIDNDQQLQEALARLPREITPQRDPWPDIEARLAAREARGVRAVSGNRGLRALAASVAVAFVAGLLFGRQSVVEETPGAVEPVAGNLTLQAALEASEREYQAAFREFIPVGVSRSVLETQAIQHIESTWVEMQQAEAALMSALREYPENAYLNQKLLDLRQQQLGFMKQLATLDQASRRKI